MLSIHVEPGARIGYSSHNSHHKLASSASQLVSQGRKLRHREVGIGLSLSKGVECGFELTTLGSKACVLSTILLTLPLEGF